MTIALDEKQYIEDVQDAYDKGINSAFGGFNTGYAFIYKELIYYLPQQPDTSMHEMD